MHPSALNFGKLFYEAYCSTLQGAVVHDVGAQNVNGSLRDVLPPHLGYVGVDFVAGKGVDIVLEDPYRLPFADESLDVIVCSSCFEHSQFFWLVFLEMLRVLKPQGLLYINVPSNGTIHRYPVDCWRFYPDAGRALEAWAARNGQTTMLLESFVGERSPDSYESGGAWHDYVAVYVKDRQHAGAYPRRMLDSLAVYSSGYDSRTGVETRPAFLSPDQEAVVVREKEIAALRQELADARNEIGRREGREAALRRLLVAHALQLRESRSTEEAMEARLEELLRSPSWRLMAPARKTMSAARSMRSGVRALGGRLRDARRNIVAADAALLRASGQFDEAFYRTANPDLPPEADAIAHYCQVGWREGRDPSPAFSTRHYLATYADIREAGMNPFVHYIAAGAAEQRQPLPWPVATGPGEEPDALDAEVQVIRASGQFDEAYYRGMHADLGSSADAVRHYCERGWREGRDPSPRFSTRHYLEVHADVREAGVNPLFHSIVTARRQAHRGGGQGDGDGGERRAREAALAAEIELIRHSGQFDADYYRAMNPDLQPPPEDPVRHYCERGWREGRNPSDAFDTKGYLAEYRDIRDGGVNPFWHYLVAGAAEFRDPLPGAGATYEDDIRFGV
ncbi:class I SAM-dependent methyltransferase, partial [Ramlibacter cellulosilyticus]|uniref:class I SAM-dependent methyltransferase n=1 Tax=Ramlibacter cellulosilyticus TaxID=2764187 RepID=UPI001C9B1FA1